MEEAVVLNEEQSIEVLSRGQTSDQTFSLPECPSNYYPELNRDKIEDFFTYNDWAYMINKGIEAYKNFIVSDDAGIGGSYCSESCLAINLSTLSKHLRIICFFPHTSRQDDDINICLSFEFFCDNCVDGVGGNKGIRRSLGTLLLMDYSKFRSELLSSFGIYDFSGDLSVIPCGVVGTFANCVESIDIDIYHLKDGFISLCIALHGLSTYDKSNFYAYGCKDIYDFVEKRFGFGCTSTKNFLAIYDKFIDGVNIKPAFKDYSYSQLTELVSVSATKLSEFSSDMTVKEIREKKKEIGKSEKNAKVEAIESNQTVVEPVKVERRLNESDVLNVINKMSNPYYVADKEKQSARYDAYEKALNDVLFMLHEKLNCQSVIRILG